MARRGAAGRSWSNKRRLADILERVEEILRASGLDWQAVRPIRLSGGAGTGRPRITDRFPASATISRADVAAFMLAELERPRFTERTPMIDAG